MSDDQYRYLKAQTIKAAEAQDQEALFIPEWLSRLAPAAANDMLLNMAGWLHDQAQEYIAEFLSAFPDASPKSVFNELICLAFPQASPEPVQIRCQRNAETADALQRRLGDFAVRPAANKPFPTQQDAELNRLCI